MRLKNGLHFNDFTSTLVIIMAGMKVNWLDVSQIIAGSFERL